MDIIEGEQNHKIMYKESTIYPYKERTIKFEEPVKVYRNLNNGLLSIVQKNKVVGHADYLTISNCEFKVNQKSRERVLQTKRKNVHAYMVGYIVQVSEIFKKDVTTEIIYNPYLYKNFVDKSTGEKATIAKYGYITKEGKIYVQH